MANIAYISAGLSVAKDAGQSPSAGVNTAYASAGLPPEVLSAGDTASGAIAATLGGFTGVLSASVSDPVYEATLAPSLPSFTAALSGTFSAGPAIDVRYAVLRAALSATSGGTTDFTQTDFGTVKAAIVLVSNARVGGNPSPTQSITSVGFWDATNQLCYGGAANDNVATSDTYRWAAAGIIARIRSSSTVIAEYTLSSITDGVRLTLTYDATTLERYATVILFGGDEAAGYIGYEQLNAVQDADTVVTGVGFLSDAIVFGSIGRTTHFVEADDLTLSFGCVVNDGSLTQRALAQHSLDGQGATKSCSLLAIDRAVAILSDDAFTRSAEVTAIGSDGFTLTTRDGTGGQYVFYLALDLGGSALSLSTLTTPTATGDDELTGMGFQPELAIAAGGLITATDTVTQQLSFSIGASDGTQDSAIAGRDLDAADTTDCDSESNERLIDFRAATDGSDLTAATLGSFDAGGLTLSYSAADGTAYKGWILALSNSEPAVTFTGDIDVTMGGVTTSLAATFAPGTHTASLTPSLPGFTTALTGTFDAPVYEGQLSPSLPGLQTALTATFAVDTFTASLAPTVPGLTAALSATVTEPVYEATLAPTVPGVTVALQAAFAVEVYSASLAPGMPALTTALTATFEPPVYTADLTPTMGGITVSLLALFASEVYAASLTPTLPGLSTSLEATFTAPVYTANMTLTMGAISVDIDAVFVVAEFVLGECTITSQQLTGCGITSQQLIDCDITSQLLTDCAITISH